MEPAMEVDAAGLEIKVAAASLMSSELLRELDDWFDQQFGHIPYEWANPEWYVFARRERGLVGRLSIVQRQVSVADQQLRVGGIGGVTTKPEFRRRGIATALLLRAATFIRDELRVEFGLLLCQREVASVYARIGWVPVPGPTRFSQSPGTHSYPGDTMILRCSDRDWPPGPIDLCGLPW